MRTSPNRPAALLWPVLALVLASCGNETPEGPPAGLAPTLPDPFLAVKNGRQYDLGKGDLAWHFDLEGWGAKSVTIQLLYVRGGEALTWYEGSFKVTPKPFAGSLVLVEQHGQRFGAKGKTAFALDAALEPTSTSESVRSGSWTLEGVERKSLTWLGQGGSHKVPLGKELILLQIAFRPRAGEVRSWDAFPTVAETKAATKEQGHRVVALVASWEEL